MDDILGARGRCDGCGLTLEMDTDHNEIACLGRRIERLEQFASGVLYDNIAWGWSKNGCRGFRRDVVDAAKAALE